MADNSFFEFYPSFNEFLPLYRNVTRVWIGNGTTTGTIGMLYVEYEDGSVAQVGSVSMYQTAVDHGYTGTEQQWFQMIMSVANLVKGSAVTITYQVSTDGVNHPNENTGWSDTPRYEKGKFTWTKVDLVWIDGTHTPLYFCSYYGTDGEPGTPGQDGEDGQVRSVNDLVGDVFLHGDNIPIDSELATTIKEYIDASVVPDLASDVDIDNLFSSAILSGAVFIAGRRFAPGDSIELQIEAVTTGAPLPTQPRLLVYPTEGNSFPFNFDNIVYKSTDIPEGEESATFEYIISESSHSLDSTTSDDTEYHVFVTVYDEGDGSIKIEKSNNYNSLYFVHTYTAMGALTFEGSIRLDGRAMAAREFMVQIKEGNNVIAENLSTSITASSGVPSAIVFPAISYTLADIGTHIYKVKQTSTNGNGVTVDTQEYTVTVQVTDNISDGTLEIATNGTHQNLDFVNTYAASGTITFIGNKTVIGREFMATDEYSVAITGNGALPSPATLSVALPVEMSTVDFSFPTVTYTLNDMRNALNGYDDVKTFNYTVTENAVIPGIVPDSNIHTIAVTVTDDKHGNLVANAVYSDGNKIMFGGTYGASGTLTISGRKTLANRKFVANDTMSVSVRATDGGKTPSAATIPVTLTVGQSYADFSFATITYNFSDLGGLTTKTYNYIIEESTVITGATNDANVHSLAVQLSDNFDGTLSVIPVYSDGQYALFESIYNAVGYVVLNGTKTLNNRNFNANDILSMTITSSNNGRLPNPATINVGLTSGANTANFSFPQITYTVADLGGLVSKTFNYSVTENCTMAGTTAATATDTVSVIVSDNSDGTLSVVPTYSANNKLNFVNTYTATGVLSFRVRFIFDGGNMTSNGFYGRITQVTGNNSTIQAVENVVLAEPVTLLFGDGTQQDLNFINVGSFTNKPGSYWFMIDQVLPTLDSENVYNNVRYDTTKKWINISVTDNQDGTLGFVKTPSVSPGTPDMIFTNVQLGALSVSISWTGNYDQLTNTQKNSFAFEVVGSDYDETFTYGDLANNSITINKLALGEYTLTVTPPTLENYQTTIYCAAGGGYSLTNEATVTLVGGTTGNVSIMNNIYRLAGNLTVTKTWSGDTVPSEDMDTVTFAVTGPKQWSTDASTYSASFTYGDMVNDSYTLEGLTLGTYTVTETANITDFEITTTYTVSNEATNEIVLANNDNKVCRVNNTCTYLGGE